MRGEDRAPSRLGRILAFVVLVVCRRCLLGCRRIRHHPPPLLIVLSCGFLIVLLVSLASSTIRAEGTTNVSYCIIIRLYLSQDYLLVFLLHASIVIYRIFITCCFVLIYPTVMFPYEAHLFTNNISCSISYHCYDFL